ncbi:MAG TPA: hypothetical protein VLI90_04220 [Tepidisphaeraceae bacterium]|nr:hypothetical protein [Tepidisphaeraceae bacterium]
MASNATDFARHLGSYEPTLLAYMATPFIFSATPGQFSPALFRAFCDCYVDGFLATFQAIRQRNPNLTRVFYPSSSAVEQTPANMGEYAAAKRAAESLCQYLESVHRKLRIHTPRLPRLATDQTASLLQAEMPDAAELMLEHLRQTLLSEEE